MKISVLLASPDALDYNLIDVMRVLNTTFDELGEKLHFIKLDQRNIPPLTNQYPVNDVANIVNQLSNSDGVIFACTANLFTPCSVMQNFLDYLSLPIYNNFLKDKNCFTIVVSNEYGEMEAAQYLTSVIQHFGGFSPIVTYINRQISSQFNNNKEISEIFEKQVEDYYRILRQNRKFFGSFTNVVEQQQQTQNIQQNFNNFDYVQQPSPNHQQVQQQPQQPQQQYQPQQQTIQNTPQQNFNQNIQNQQHQQSFAQGEYLPNGEQYLQDHYTGIPNFDASQNIQEKLGVSQASNLTNRSYTPEPLQPQNNNNVDFNSIDQKQDNSFLDNNLDFDYSPSQAPINTQQKTMDINPQHTNFPDNHIQQMESSTSTNLSIKEQTLKLEQKFLAQQSKGLVTEIQIKINGSENFDVYIQINGTDCRCHEGLSPSSDLTVISSADVWQEVLQGNITAQKAFMTGQLKVRGNFVLLPRFDALFKD